MHYNQPEQVINNDQHNINNQVESRIHHLEAGREDYRTRPPQPRGQLHEHTDGETYRQLHEHADGDTCLFRRWDDESRHQFTQFLETKDSKQVLREGLETALQEIGTFKDSLEKALQESNTFKYIRDYVHGQQDRGSGQRHALRHPPTVGRGMQAGAENGEEESARPPAAAHDHASNRRRTSFYAEARGGAALDGRAYANAEEEESDENFEGV